MKALFVRLCHDETGAILSAEVMLVATILVIGMIVGLKSVRDSVVTELADVAQALANVNQSYTFSGAAGHHTFSGGGQFADQADFCDTEDSSDRGNSKCVVICCTPSRGEGRGGHHGGHGDQGGYGG